MNPARAARSSLIRSRCAVLALLLVGAGCASSGRSKSAPADTAPQHPIGEIVEKSNEPAPIGKLLSDLDVAMQRWNQLLLAGTTRDDHEKALKLELWIQGEAHRRRAEIVEQLESGPTQNRIVAAMALGFTREVEAQSPLLAALDDHDTQVVGNALLGLWLLERADTPLDKICALLRTSSDPTLRSNASLCLARLTGKGARSDCAAEAARIGLLDNEPSVRSQSAAVLGNVLDRGSIVALSDHLQDPVVLVAATAARAVAHIGKEIPTEKGKAARALAKTLDSSRGVLRDQTRLCLIDLAGADLGKDPQDWLEWATRLP
jgi:HEAT repeat protein